MNSQVVCAVCMVGCVHGGLWVWMGKNEMRSCHACTSTHTHTHARTHTHTHACVTHVYLSHAFADVLDTISHLSHASLRTITAVVFVFLPNGKAIRRG